MAELKNYSQKTGIVSGAVSPVLTAEFEPPDKIDSLLDLVHVWKGTENLCWPNRMSPCVFSITLCDIRGGDSQNLMFGSQSAGSVFNIPTLY